MFMKQKNLQWLFKAFGLTLALFSISVLFGQPVNAATYTVTSTADSGAGSLRQAILDANGNAGPDQVDFAIVGAGQHLITLSSTLPTINGQITINGLSQPGSSCNGTSTQPMIAIDNNNLVNNFIINSGDGTEINGLAMANGGLNTYAMYVGADDVTIRCNFFGTFDGQTSASAQINSDYLTIHGDNATVGGSNVTDTNLFLGRSSINADGGGTALTIRNNIIGASIDGLSEIPDVAGININSVYAGSVISNNHIAQNSNIGIYYALSSSGSDNIFIQNNIIGTDILGSTAFSDTENAIQLSGNHDNVVVSGNTIVATGSNTFGLTTVNGVISGATIQNNKINVSTDGSTEFIGSGSGNSAILASDSSDWLIDGNIIYGKIGQAISLQESSGFVITDNIIGMDSTKTTCFTDQKRAISISNSQGILIGGTSPGTGNTICTAGIQAGIYVSGATTEAVSILGNSIQASGLPIEVIIDTDWLIAPVLTSYSENAGDTDITFRLDVPAGNYRVEFFENTAQANSNGFAQAMSFVGSVNVTSSGTGNQTFTETISGDGYAFLAATVTLIDGSPDNGFGATSNVGSLTYQTDLEIITDDSVNYVSEDATGHEIEQVITNLGPTSLTDINLDLSGTSCINITGVTTGGSATDPGAYNSGSWSGTLDVDQTLILTFSGDITCSAVDTMTFEAVQTSLYFGDYIVEDISSGNNDTTDTSTIVEAVTDLEIATTDGESQVAAGSTGHEVTQTITNYGPATVTDLSFSNSGTNCFNATGGVTGGTATTPGTYNSLNWTGSLESGQTLILTISGNINCAPGNTMTFSHQITSLYAGATQLYDSTNSNNDFDDTSSVYSNVTDVAVNKVLNNPEDIAAGGTLEYTLTLGNNGPEPIDLTDFDFVGPGGNPFEASLFIDVMPEDLSFIADSSTNPDIDCDFFNPATVGGGLFSNHTDYNIITCRYTGAPANLNTDETISTTISATVDITSDLNFNNYVISGWVAEDPDLDIMLEPFTGGGPNCANDSDIIDCYMGEGLDNIYESLPMFDLTLDKEITTVGAVAAGDTLSYNITTENKGPMPVDLTLLTQGVLLADIFPATDLTYVDSDNPDVQCSDIGPATNFLGPAVSAHPDHNLLICAFTGNSQMLNVNDALTFSLNFTVNNGFSSTFTNYAIQSQIPVDPDSAALLGLVGGAGGDILDSVTNENFAKATYVASDNNLDTDGDGITDVVEDAGPNGGDANNDSVQDSQQSHVASFVNTATGKRSALAVSSECDIATSSTNPESTNGSQDSAYAYPLGFMGFEIDCTTPGYTATITQYHFDQSNDNYILRKYHPTSKAYSTIESASIANQTIGGLSTVVASYQITDGSSLDVDGATDGSITDPAGLAVVQADLATTGQAQKYILLIASAFVLASVTVLVVRKLALKK